MLKGRKRKTKQCRLTKRGAIESMTLPLAWQQTDKISRQYYMLTFSPPHAAELAGICFFALFRSLPSQCVWWLKQTLNRDAHVLDNLQDDSFMRIAGLHFAMDDFVIEKAWTEDINGKRVLIAQGRDEEEGYASTGMFFCPPDNPRFVQELVFSAREDLYDTYFDAAMQSFGSINWTRQDYIRRQG